MPEPVDLNFVTTDVLGGSVLQWATPFTGVNEDPMERDAALREAFGWDADVEVGSVTTSGWAFDAP